MGIELGAAIIGWVGTLGTIGAGIAGAIGTGTIAAGIVGGIVIGAAIGGISAAVMGGRRVWHTVNLTWDHTTISISTLTVKCPVFCRSMTHLTQPLVIIEISITTNLTRIIAKFRVE